MLSDPATRELIVRFRAAHGKMKAAADELLTAEEQQADEDRRALLLRAKQHAQEEVLSLIKKLNESRLH